jgi:hypothetical protein
MKVLAVAVLALGLISCLSAVVFGALVSGDQQALGAVAMAISALGIIAVGVALLWQSNR